MHATALRAGTFVPHGNGARCAVAGPWRSDVHQRPIRRPIRIQSARATRTGLDLALRRRRCAAATHRLDGEKELVGPEPQCDASSVSLPVPPLAPPTLPPLAAATLSEARLGFVGSAGREAAPAGRRLGFIEKTRTVHNKKQIVFGEQNSFFVGRKQNHFRIQIHFGVIFCTRIAAQRQRRPGLRV